MPHHRLLPSRHTISQTHFHLSGSFPLIGKPHASPRLRSSSPAPSPPHRSDLLFPSSGMTRRVTPPPVTTPPPAAHSCASSASTRPRLHAQPAASPSFHLLLPSSVNAAGIQSLPASVRNRPSVTSGHNSGSPPFPAPESHPQDPPSSFPFIVPCYYASTHLSPFSTGSLATCCLHFRSPTADFPVSFGPLRSTSKPLITITGSTQTVPAIGRSMTSPTGSPAKIPPRARPPFCSSSTAPLCRPPATSGPLPLDNSGYPLRHLPRLYLPICYRVLR